MVKLAIANIERMQRRLSAASEKVELILQKQQKLLSQNQLLIDLKKRP